MSVRSYLREVKEEAETTAAAASMIALAITFLLLFTPDDTEDQTDQADQVNKLSGGPWAPDGGNHPVEAGPFAGNTYAEGFADGTVHEQLLGERGELGPHD